MSQITTHVLDTALGKPAADIYITLSHWKNNQWHKLGSGISNQDGRDSDLLDASITLEAGRYQVAFQLEDYFIAQNRNTFYPFAEIVFEIKGDGQHYHIPLLLAPYGYSTYRGS